MIACYGSVAMGGFAALGTGSRRVAGVSEPHVVQFPPSAGNASVAWLVWRPKRRPPRRKMLKMDGCWRGGLRFGHKCVSWDVSFAREPLSMRMHLLMRSSTPQHACGWGRPRSNKRVNVRMRGARAGYRVNVQDPPDASRGRTLITRRRHEASPQMGRNAWSTWRCCAESTSAATTRSS